MDGRDRWSRHGRRMDRRWVPRGRNMAGQDRAPAPDPVRLTAAPKPQAERQTSDRATTQERLTNGSAARHQRLTNASLTSEQAWLHIHQCTSRAVRLASAGASGSVGSAAFGHPSLVGLVAGGLRPAYRPAVAERPGLPAKGLAALLPSGGVSCRAGGSGRRRRGFPTMLRIAGYSAATGLCSRIRRAMNSVLVEACWIS